MDDFANQLRRRVQDAKASHNQAEERQRSERATAEDQQERRVARARSLMDDVQNRLREAAEASDGAMKYAGSLIDGIGRTAYDLYWEAPPPKRGLRVSVNYFDGLIEWTWLFRGEEGRKQYDALTFDLTTVDELVFKLADQETWGRNKVPVA